MYAGGPHTQGNDNNYDNDDNNDNNDTNTNNHDDDDDDDDSNTNNDNNIDNDNSNEATIVAVKRITHAYTSYRWYALIVRTTHTGMPIITLCLFLPIRCAYYLLHTVSFQKIKFVFAA